MSAASWETVEQVIDRALEKACDIAYRLPGSADVELVICPGWRGEVRIVWEDGARPPRTLRNWENDIDMLAVLQDWAEWS